MDIPHRERIAEEARDVWVRALPVKNLIRIIFRSLATSEYLPDLQLVSVGKFILSSLIELQELNQQCEDYNQDSANNEDCSDLVDKSEMIKYLEIFDKVFQRIVSSSEQSQSKQEIMEMVWKYYNEGTLNFSETTIPQLLVSSMSQELLQEKLLDALSDLSDKAKLRDLVSFCSPISATSTVTSVTSNFTYIMKELEDIFYKSDFHPMIMDFARCFVSEIRKFFPTNYLSIFPVYLFPLVIICDFLFLFSNDNFLTLSSTHTTATQEKQKYLNMSGLKQTQKQKKNSTSETIKMKIESIHTFLLNLLNDMYNPINIERYANTSCCNARTSFNENCISFYISACCPQVLEIIQSNLESKQINFKTLPFLCNFLQRRKYYL